MRDDTVEYTSRIVTTLFSNNLENDYCAISYIATDSSIVLKTAQYTLAKIFENNVVISVYHKTQKSQY